MIGVLEYVVEGGDIAKLNVQLNKDLILTDFDEHMNQVFGSITCVPRHHNKRSNKMDGFDYSQ